jgi:hypothetical protein
MHYDDVYATILTLYHHAYHKVVSSVIHNAEKIFYFLQEDQIYWSRVQLYNTRTDVQILADLEVKKCYWPIELQNVSTLDVPFVCATARSRYYASAIDTLQSLRCVCV